MGWLGVLRPSEYAVLVYRYEIIKLQKEDYSPLPIHGDFFRNLLPLFSKFGIIDKVFMI